MRRASAWRPSDRVLNGRAAVRPRRWNVSRRPFASTTSRTGWPRAWRAPRNIASASSCRRAPNAYMTLAAGCGARGGPGVAQEKVVIDLRHTDVFSPRCWARHSTESAISMTASPWSPSIIRACASRSTRFATAALRWSHWCRMCPFAPHPLCRDRQCRRGAHRPATLMGRYLAGRTGKVGLIAGSLSLRDHVERQYRLRAVMLHEYPASPCCRCAKAATTGKSSSALPPPAAAGPSRLIGLYIRGRRNTRHRRRPGGRGRQRQVVYSPMSSPTSPAAR